MKQLILVSALLLLVACQSKSIVSSDLSPTPLYTNQTKETAVEPSILPAAPERTPLDILPPTAFKDLSVTIAARENGFKLEPEDNDNYFVAQTLQKPNSPKVVHIMRKIDMNGSGQGRYRESAVIIDAGTQEMHIYSMMNSPIADEYSVDSVAKVYVLWMTNEWFMLPCIGMIKRIKQPTPLIP
jgi:hypothetical protein